MEAPLIPTAAGGNDHPFGFTKTGRARRVYKCRECSRIFKRSEHCARHERVHTRERPFACRFCKKSYARKDLVSRHERSLHAEEHAAAGDPRPRRSSYSGSTGPSNNKAQRQAQATSHESPGESTSTDDVLSQDGPPTPEDSSVPHARRNSYPITLSRMMSPSFFNDMDFPTWDVDQDLGSNGLQTQSSGSGEKQVASAHSSPTTTMSLSDAANNISQPLADIAVERRASETLSIIPETDETEDSRHTAHASTGQDLLLDTEMNDLFVNHTAQMVPDGVSLDVLRDLYFIPDSPLAIPQLSNFPSTIAQPAGGPFPSMHQETDTASQPLPRVMREKVTSPPKLTADDAVYEHLCGDIRSRTKEEPDLTAIPKSKELERLMEAYVSCFHCHFPIIHIASLDLPTAPGPLILSICAIGALYRLDRRRAVQLHNIASSSLHRSVSSQPPSFSSPASARPLWVVQSCLLLSMYAAFSGQSAAVLSTVEKMGFFKIEFQLKRTALQKSALEQSSPCWDEWIRRESSKRLLCGIFIMTNLFSVTYGTTPLFSIEQDLTFETPSEEKLWDARTAELWEDARASRHAASAPTTLREAIVATFFNQPPDSGPAPPPQISGFTALLITHAANVHMWSIIQFSASFPAPLSHSILTTTFASLVRWHTALGHGSVETPEAAYYNNASSIPLVFNCHALLRIAYVRLFGNSCAFPKMILLASDDGEIAAAMANYVAAPQPRNAFLTKSIAKAYEGFITPVRLGHLLIKKTAALSWSVEHAVAAWDSVLFVSKWVHAVQMEGGAADGEEERIVAQLEGLLEEMEFGYNGVGSLAAAVTRAWAGFLTDTWVWGVTPRMGYILMQLATAYDNAYQAVLS